MYSMHAYMHSVVLKADMSLSVTIDHQIEFGLMIVVVCVCVYVLHMHFSVAALTACN